MLTTQQPQGQDDETLNGLRRTLGTGLGGGLGAGPSPLSGPQPLMPQQQSRAPGAPAPGAAPAPGGGGQPAPAPMAGAAGGGGAGAATTFAQLQASGIARPAPPPAAPAPMAQMAPGATGGYTASPGAPLNDVTPKPQDSAPPANPNGPTSPPGTPDAPPPAAPPAGTPPPATPPGAPPATPAAASTKYPLQDDIEAQIKKILGMGSPYDDAAFQNDVGREYNKIDDQYALGQKGLSDELGKRGLGTTGDSSIGLGRMSDLNVGRKSAKATVLSDLSTARAKSQVDDLARELGIATSYGQGAQQLTLEQQQQQFNTQLAIAQLLAQLGYKMPAGATVGAGTGG